MSAVPELETARLRLRPWRATDVGAYAAMIGDPEVMRLMGSGWRHRAKRVAASLVASFSDLEARRAIASLERHWAQWGFGEWAVEEKASGDMIGQIGLVHHADWPASRAKVEIGWTLARRSWGRSFATEGATVALAYGFDRLELERVISIARPENRRSLRVMESLGLKRQGGLRWHGSDVVWYAIDRAVWLRR